MGLYIHIPFCQQICHYCDFSKTALYSEVFKKNYFRSLDKALEYWVARCGSVQWTSLYIGGGTPSLFDQEYWDLFQQLRRYMSSDCEVTLEANPQDISTDKLLLWKDLGVNRLSLGIQSFQREGLMRLTRQHDPHQARQAVEWACDVFDNVSIDLIYGWPGQSLKTWQQDLQIAARDCGIQHLSAYSLTYEPGTVFFRKKKSGRMRELSEMMLRSMYDCCVDILDDQGFEHYELSNWCRAGRYSTHNRNYWLDGYYIGIGSGAHGYLPEGPWGVRYYYHKLPHRFVKDPTRVDLDERDQSQWLLEQIFLGIRTQWGINVPRLEQKLPIRIDLSMFDGPFVVDDQGCIHLKREEWFCEQRWALVLYDAILNLLETP